MCTAPSPERARRLDGLDEIIISLYAGGMTIRDIQHHLASTIGTELSPETISNITHAALDEFHAWRFRPLDALYPVVYVDALVVTWIERTYRRYRRQAALGCLTSIEFEMIMTQTATQAA